MSRRLHERCQNPECARPLDEVRPPLRRDAKYCSRECGASVRDARREGLTRPDASQAYWEAIRARRDRASRVSGRMRARHRAAA